MMKKIGFVGCGTMGKRMALNLLKAGHKVAVYDISPEPLEELRAAGAVVASSIREVAGQSEVVCTSLPYPADVEGVISGPDGIIAGGKKGTIIIDFSTIGPTLARSLSQEAVKAGMDMLYAPVSGGPDGAAAGTLTLMVGGKKDKFDECKKEVLDVVGKNIFYIAEDQGAASLVKLCNNILAEMQMIAMAETVVFGVKGGLDPKIVFDVINTIRGGDWLLEHKFPYAGVIEHCPANNDFEAQFFNDLMAKDMGIAMQAANEMKLPLLMCTLAYQMCEATSAIGLGRKDASAVTRLVQQLAGM